jgi:glycosyltransferase involved in cell wall biosynthesis
MKISACMIVKNEENNIEMCINSYKDIVDEIIVVDTGSKDRTVEIAKKLGAKVYFIQWNNDFASAKNYAIDKAKGDWIIFLDADEYFGSNSSGKIRNILKNLTKQYNVIGCKITNIDTVNSRTIDSFLQARIFKNDKNIRYKSNVHEVLYSKVGKLHLISYYNEINIYHTGYSSDINREKAKRNLEILLESINIQGENPDNYRYLCDCYFSLEDYHSALKYGELHLNSGLKTLGYQSRIHKVIIDCMWKLGKPKGEIEERIKDSISLFPDHPNFYCSYGFFLLDDKRYNEALYNLLLTLKYNETYNGIEVNLVLGIVSYINYKIGYIYEMINDYERALQYYYISLNKDKYNEVSFMAVYNIIKNQKLEEIVDFFSSIYSTNNEKDLEFFISILIKIKPKGILAYYTNIWYKKFHHEDKALTFTLLSEGKYKSAFNIFYKGYLENYDEENSVLLITSALLCEDKDNLEEIKKIVKPSLKRIIAGYIDNDDKDRLYHSDIDDYSTLLSELLLFNNKEVLNRFLKLSKLFEVNIYNKIAKVFENNMMYKEALNYYDECAEGCNLKDIYMSKGYCYFKLKQYSEAFINFKNAIEEGYQENDVYEFINWIKKLEMPLDDTKNEKLDIDTENDKYREFDEYKKMAKKNICNLLEAKQSGQAKFLIEEYLQIVPDDLEMLMLKSEAYLQLM